MSAVAALASQIAFSRRGAAFPRIGGLLSVCVAEEGSIEIKLGTGSTEGRVEQL